MRVVKGYSRRTVEKMSVIETHHVIGEGNHSLARETYATRSNAAIFGIRHSPLFPMPVGIENGRKRPFTPAQRAIQVATQIEARESFEINFFDAITVAFDAPEHALVQ